MAAKISLFSSGSEPGCFAELSVPRLTFTGLEIFFLVPNYDIPAFSEDAAKFTPRISCS